MSQVDLEKIIYSFAMLCKVSFNGGQLRWLYHPYILRWLELASHGITTELASTWATRVCHLSCPFTRVSHMGNGKKGDGGQLMLIELQMR